ncbi:MAG: hypothetical protein FWB91_10195 [Defluviitaleaceae bacterium]|nr:hypothetical protein [Defluviitaleaceae bacterium]
MTNEQAFAQFLIQAYTFFLGAYSFDISSFDVDIVVLSDISKRHFKDVERLRQYHNIPRVDSNKIAGYATYWISRLRPISVTNPEMYRSHSEFFAYT